MSAGTPDRAPDGASLLLIPTELERQRFEDQGGLDPSLAVTELCGFGPVAAAARTAMLLARLRPRRVLLLGIAGAFDVERDPPGSALEFGSVAIDGIGVGEGEQLVPPPGLGFPQWPGSAETTPHPVVDRIALPAARPGAGLLLTTCAASDGEDLAARRRSRFPEARAEDMEGFAVAMACVLSGTAVRIVRGISNRVGDRDPSHWCVPAALAAARRTALELFEGPSGAWCAEGP